MKNISVVLSSLALVGVIILLGMHFSGSKNTTTTSVPVSATTAPSGKIAYIDIDSLEANYVYLKTKKEEFRTRQQQAETELQRSSTQMQNEIAQKRFEQMQQSLMTRKQALTDQLMKEQEEFNKDLKSRLDAFLAEYNKDKHYDYILSYGNGGSILYTNKALDITNDVINGMNAQIKNEGDKKNK